VLLAAAEEVVLVDVVDVAEFVSDVVEVDDAVAAAAPY
jgi:hypothetical protein